MNDFFLVFMHFLKDKEECDKINETNRVFLIFVALKKAQMRVARRFDS